MMRTATPDVVPPATKALETCDHASLEYLGAGGPAQYFRCRGCSAVLIEQAVQSWILRGRPRVA